jgi:hypothetical protein
LKPATKYQHSSAYSLPHAAINSLGSSAVLLALRFSRLPQPYTLTKMCSTATEGGQKPLTRSEFKGHCTTFLKNRFITGSVLRLLLNELRNAAINEAHVVGLAFGVLLTTMGAVDVHDIAKALVDMGISDASVLHTKKKRKATPFEHKEKTDVALPVAAPRAPTAQQEQAIVDLTEDGDGVVDDTTPIDCAYLSGIPAIEKKVGAHSYRRIMTSQKIHGVIHLLTDWAPSWQPITDFDPAVVEAVLAAFTK